MPKKTKINLEGEMVRVVLVNGATRAGKVVTDSPDVMVLVAPNGDEGIIIKGAITEIWKGLGPKTPEPGEV